MAFASKLLPGEQVIGDDYHGLLPPPRGMSTGYESRNLQAFPIGYCAHAEAPDVPRDPAQRMGGSR